MSEPKIKPCCAKTLRALAEAMKKTLPPNVIEEIKWSADPLGEFLKVLRATSQGGTR